MPIKLADWLATTMPGYNLNRKRSIVHRRKGSIIRRDVIRDVV